MIVILGLFVFIGDGINYAVNVSTGNCYTPSVFLTMQQGYLSSFASIVFAVAVFVNRQIKPLGIAFLCVFAVLVPLRLLTTLLGLHYFGLKNTADSVILAMTSIGIGGYQVYLMYQANRIVLGKWYDTSQFVLIQRIDICYTEVLLAIWLLIVDGINYTINFDTQKKWIAYSLVISGYLFAVVTIVCSVNILFWNNVTRFSVILFITTLICGIARLIASFSGLSKLKTLLSEAAIINASVPVLIALLQIYLLYDCVRMYYVAEKEALQTIMQDTIQGKIVDKIQEKN